MQAAVKLTSWNDFRLIFGGFLPYSYLAYAVRGFFATGGETCYVARVGVAATPPTLAFMPLPAAITSTLIAHLGNPVTPGATQISLDSPFDLAIGNLIAIGDPADPALYPLPDPSINGGVGSVRWPTVASVIDSMTVTINPALATGHDAGEPVYKLAGPAVAVPITFIAAATISSQTQIRLESSDVVSAGDLIAIGDPLGGDCVSVMSIVDDQTVTVQPPLESKHNVGDAVYPVLGSALSLASAIGDSSLTVAKLQFGKNDRFASGDLVTVESDGVSELRNVVAVTPTTTTLQLGLALNFAHKVGAAVRKYDAAFSVTAASPGAWGNGINLEVRALDRGNAVTHFSLRVTVDQGADPVQPQQQEFYPLLSLDPADPSAGDIYAPDVLKASQLIQISPDSIAQGTLLLVDTGPLQSGNVHLEGGSDGAPNTTTGAPTLTVANPCKSQAAPPPPNPKWPYPSPPNATNQDFQDALDVLGLVDEIAILCCPDAAGPPPQTPAANPWSMQVIQQTMVEQCVRLQYRVAVLDTPRSQASGAPLQPAQALTWLNQQGYSDPAARFVAVYYPWLNVPDALGIEGPSRTVPPCGHVAGAYAYTDNQFGVQKPPANVELHFVSNVQLAVTNQQQGFLNPAGINAIRAIPGRGTRVWGARSLASSLNPDWQYIHTRRLMSMIEDSVERASRWVVFQTNDDDLRRMLTHSLNVFLQNIWFAGGLKGARPTDSYFVKCDSTNNPQSSIDAGQLICQVGVAIAAPMEFLVFEMRRDVTGAQVVEA